MSSIDLVARGSRGDVVVHFTLIRHGESTDNVKSIWAGWRDAPLTNHGRLQADALGLSLAHIKFHAIMSSSLKRAYMTAQALCDGQRDPKPPLVTSPLLREQHFGSAEGRPYGARRDRSIPLAEHHAQGKFPPLRGRHERFPDGESLEDVAQRAHQAIDKFLCPYINISTNDGIQDVHIAIVSHGIFIRELAVALLQRFPSELARTTPLDFRGLRNTGWTRIAVKAQEMETPKGKTYIAQVAMNNCHDHLLALVSRACPSGPKLWLSGFWVQTRQKGGVGSSAFDPKQKDIRTFFRKPGKGQ